MKVVPRHSPRHYPEFAAEFGPRGWSVFRVGNAVPEAHGVLYGSLPVVCAARFGFSEHVQAEPETFRETLERAASAIERHAERCPDCAAALKVAVRRVSALREGVEWLG